MTAVFLALQVVALLNAAALALVAVDILFGKEIYAELGVGRGRTLFAGAMLAVLAFAFYVAGTA